MGMVNLLMLLQVSSLFCIWNWENWNLGLFGGKQIPFPSYFLLVQTASGFLLSEIFNSWYSVNVKSSSLKTFPFASFENIFLQVLEIVFHRNDCFYRVFVVQFSCNASVLPRQDLFVDILVKWLDAVVNGDHVLHSFIEKLYEQFESHLQDVVWIDHMNATNPERKMVL